METLGIKTLDGEVLFARIYDKRERRGKTKGRAERAGKPHTSLRGAQEASLIQGSGAVELILPEGMSTKPKRKHYKGTGRKR